MAYTTNFAEFEVKELRFLITPALEPGMARVFKTKCIGTSEQEDEISVVTKPCGRTVIEKRVSPTGNGTIAIAAHMREDLINEIYNMTREGLIPGVRAMGNTVLLPEFVLIERITDMKGREKIRIFPRVQAEEGMTRSLDNSADEVSYQELSLTYMPDDHGEGYYDALVEALEGAEDIETWLEELVSDFTPDKLYTNYIAQSETVEA